MCARQEKDKINENKIKKILVGCPEIIKDYMISINEMTSLSRLNYLRHVVDYYNFIQSLDIKIEEVKPIHINKYMEYIRYDQNGNENGTSIRNTKLSAVKSFYNFLVFNDYIDVNPCDKVKKLKNKKKSDVTYLTPEEITEVREYMLQCGGIWKKRNECLFVLGVTTGLRISAICNIDIDDINFKNKTIRVIEKGDVLKDIEIGDGVCDVIKEWMMDREKILNDCGKKTQALLIGARHDRLSIYVANDIIKNNTYFLNKHITPHKMRSTCGVNLYAISNDIMLVKERLGHRNIQNTMIYMKVVEDQKREAATLMDSLI